MISDKYGKEIKKPGKLFYACDECGFKYTEIEWAEKCQAWCKEHNNCSMEITKHAIKI